METLNECLIDWPDLWRYPELWVAAFMEGEITPKQRIDGILNRLTGMLPSDPQAVGRHLLEAGELLAVEFLLEHGPFLNACPEEEREILKKNLMQQVTKTRKAALGEFRREGRLLQERADRQENPRFSQEVAADLEQASRIATDRTAHGLDALQQAREKLDSQEEQLRINLRSQWKGMVNRPEEPDWRSAFEDTVSRGDWSSARWMLNHPMDWKQNPMEIDLFHEPYPWPFHSIPDRKICQVFQGTAIPPTGFESRWSLSPNDQPALNFVRILEEILSIKENISHQQAHSFFESWSHLFLPEHSRETEQAITIFHDNGRFRGILPELISSWLPGLSASWQDQGGLSLLLPDAPTSKLSLDKFESQDILFDPWKTVSDAHGEIIILRPISLFRLLPYRKRRWALLIREIGQSSSIHKLLTVAPPSPILGNRLGEQQYLQALFNTGSEMLKETLRSALLLFFSAIRVTIDNQIVIDNLIYLAGHHPPILWKLLYKTLTKIYARPHKARKYLTVRDIKESWCDPAFQANITGPLLEKLEKSPLSKTIFFNLSMASATDPCGITSCLLNSEEIAHRFLDDEDTPSPTALDEALETLVRTNLLEFNEKHHRWLLNISGVQEIVLEKL